MDNSLGANLERTYDTISHEVLEMKAVAGLMSYIQDDATFDVEEIRALGEFFLTAARTIEGDLEPICNAMDTLKEKAPPR